MLIPLHRIASRRDLPLAFSFVVVGAVLALVITGRDLLTNPIFVFVWMWVGLVPISLLLGQFWRATNRWRTIHRCLCAVARRACRAAIPCDNPVKPNPNRQAFESHKSPAALPSYGRQESERKDLICSSFCQVGHGWAGRLAGCRQPALVSLLLGLSGWAC
jgi:hypothetical protein